ncbi:MAG: hypothetical protein ABII90_10630 [Bacteroidota bacterium]
MKNSTVFTSTLSKELLNELDYYAKKSNKNKNQILETALKRFLEKLKRLKYVRSFKRARKNQEVTNLAEEGLEEYFKNEIRFYYNRFLTEFIPRNEGPRYVRNDNYVMLGKWE